MQAGETLYAAWVSVASAHVAETLAREGWDAVIIDMQHGLADYADMMTAIPGIVAAGAIPVVRVPIGDDPLLGRTIDAGALGVICPMVNSGQDAAWFARSCKYPPLGSRSWAPLRAMAVLGMERDAYLHTANDLILSFAMVETQAALKHIDSICSTPGIDAIFVGPNDLAVSLTGGEAVDPTHPEVVKALRQIVRKCEAYSVVPGAYANTPEIAREYRDMGFRFIAVANDQAYLRAGTQAMLAGARSDG